jgi:hypothetical protein
MVHFGLTGKPRDEVGAEAEGLHASDNLEDSPPVLITGVPPSHSPQHRIATALERHVKVGREEAAGGL